MSDVRRLKIMMFCAHPGDAFDDSGGTLCHHSERGDEVTVVIVTTGARSHAAMFTDEKRKPKGMRNEKLASLTAEEIAEFKAKEVIAAGKELGITLRVIQEGEGSLSEKQEYVFKKEVIDKFTIKECSRCPNEIPWCEMYDALDNGGYCSYCLKKKDEKNP